MTVKGHPGARLMAAHSRIAELEAEVERLREAIERHKDGNIHMSETNLRLWDALDSLDRGF